MVFCAGHNRLGAACVGGSETAERVAVVGICGLGWSGAVRRGAFNLVRRHLSSSFKFALPKGTSRSLRAVWSAEIVESAVVEKCLECDRYEMEIENLEQGVRFARADVFKAEPSEARNFQLLLQLADRILKCRRNYDRHRMAHSRAQ
jgi:hypothetical protein